MSFFPDGLRKYHLASVDVAVEISPGLVKLQIGLSDTDLTCSEAWELSRALMDAAHEVLAGERLAARVKP